MNASAPSALSDYDLTELVRFHTARLAGTGAPAVWRWPFEDPALNARASTYAGLEHLLSENAEAIERWSSRHRLDAAARLAEHAEEARRRAVDEPLWGVLDRVSGRIRAAESFPAALAGRERTGGQPVVRERPGAAWRVPSVGEANAATQPLPARVREHVDAAVRHVQLAAGLTAQAGGHPRSNVFDERAQAQLVGMLTALIPLLHDVASIARRHVERYGTEHAREDLWQGRYLQAVTLIAVLEIQMDSAAARAHEVTNRFQHYVNGL